MVIVSVIIVFLHRPKSSKTDFIGFDDILKGCDLVVVLFCLANRLEDDFLLPRLLQPVVEPIWNRWRVLLCMPNVSLRIYSRKEVIEEGQQPRKEASG